MRKSLRFGLDLVLEEAGDDWNWFVYDDDASRVVARGKCFTIEKAQREAECAGEKYEASRAK